MKKLLVAAALAIAALAYAVPGNLLVISKKEVQADAAAGLTYLGSCASGYLYSGSAAALARVTPYRVLDDRAAGKYHFLVLLPTRSALAAGDLAAAGEETALGKEYLLAVGSPTALGDLRAREPRLRIRELRPTVRAKWKAAAEAPPTHKDNAIDAAIKTITADEYAGYIGKLQGYGTRYSFTPGCEVSRNWLRNWFAGQNLDADWDPFECGRYENSHYPQADGNIYLDDYHCMVRRSRDRGATWEIIRPAHGTAGQYYDPPACWWVDNNNGYMAGIDGYLATTSDGGESWDFSRYATPPAEGFLGVYGIAFYTAEVGLLSYIRWVGAGQGYTGTPYLLKTFNGGRTWQELPLGSLRSFNRLTFADDMHMWAMTFAIGSSTRFYFSQDGGVTWSDCSGPITSDEFVCDIAAVATTEAWGVTTNGRVIHTTDGLNWSQVNTGFTGAFRQVEFPSANIGFIAGNPLIKTADGGATWHEVTAAPEAAIPTMAFADANHGVIVDYYGDNCYRTDDGGATWVDIGARLNAPEYNVVAERKGTTKPDEIVIIGGHYDSISTDRPWDCPGAEDDASGTAVAMCAARAFRNTAFKRTVRFLGFGDEEGYLLGSAAYAEECAARGEKIVALLNADMVSYDEEHGGRDDLTVGTPEEYEWLALYLQAVGALYGQNLIYDWEDYWISDDAPFSDAGYPAMGVIEGVIGVGGEIDYPYYHTTEDTLDKLQPEFGARCARDLAAMLAHLAGVAGTLPDPPEPDGPARPFAREFAVYPNPYRVTTSAAAVHFVGLQTPATVAVYDIVGRKVASWDVGASAGDECCWRPAAGSSPLAAGIYLYVVEGDNQRETGKLAVVR